MNSLIQKSLRENIITDIQAQKIEALIKKETLSKKIAFCFIAGCCLIVAAITFFFIAYWSLIPSLIKILALLFMVFASSFSGYYFENHKNFQRLAKFLFFAAALLFGALIFLILYLYGTSFISYRAALILWLLLILPLAYIFRLSNIVYLSEIIFAFWTALYIFADFSLFFPNFSSLKTIYSLPIIYCLLGIFYFSLGKLHNIFKNLGGISQTFIKTGFFIFCPLFLLMTFSIFFNPSWIRSLSISISDFHINFFALELMSTEILIILSFISSSKKLADILETTAITFPIVFLFALLQFDIAIIYSNFIFLIVLILMIFAGCLRKDNFYINVSVFWLVIFLSIKYFVFCWNILPRAYFFLIGGLIIIMLVIFIEFQRRRLKRKFIETIGL